MATTATTQHPAIALQVVPVPEGWTVTTRHAGFGERNLPVIALGLKPDENGNPFRWELMIADGRHGVAFASDIEPGSSSKGPNYYKASR